MSGDGEHDAYSREWLRRLIHIGSLSIAFLFAFPWFAWWMALGIGIGAMVFNICILPHLGRGFYRTGERRYWGGVPEYPIAVTLSILVFWVWLGRPDAAAFAWTLLAAGDGCANLAGRRFGRRPIPWNPRKTWEGTAAFLLVSVPVGAVLMALISQRLVEPVPLSRAALASLAGTLPSAFVESLPLRGHDNIPVTLLGGAVALAVLSL